MAAIEPPRKRVSHEAELLKALQESIIDLDVPSVGGQSAGNRSGVLGWDLLTDPQPGTEGIAGDGPARCRTVLGVEFPGLGKQYHREDGRLHRRRRGFGLLRHFDRGRADSVDLAQHPGADLTPTDQQRRAAVGQVSPSSAGAGHAPRPGRSIPRWSRRVGPSYSVRKIPSRWSSGTSRRTTSS